MLPYFLALKAEVAIARGRLDEAEQDVSAALRCAQVNDIRFYEAELYRIRVVMAAASGRWSDAREALREASRISQAQSAASLDLRATLSLARVLDTEEERQQILAHLRRLTAKIEAFHGNTDLDAARQILNAGV
jgi:ATP/maltotriose-dependent transcriptional regulator MalT